MQHQRGDVSSLGTSAAITVGNISNIDRRVVYTGRWKNTLFKASNSLVGGTIVHG